MFTNFAAGQFFIDGTSEQTEQGSRTSNHKDGQNGP